MKMTFWSLSIGDRFMSNGGMWRKMTSRTAMLMANGRLFYFGRAEIVESMEEQRA